MFSQGKVGPGLWLDTSQLCPRSRRQTLFVWPRLPRTGWPSLLISQAFSLPVLERRSE